MAPPILSLALPSETGQVLSIQSHTVQNDERKLFCLIASNRIDKSRLIALSDDIEDVDERSSSGIECCQTAIPKELKSLYLDLKSYYNHFVSWKFNPCSYAFLADTYEFKFSRSNLSNYTGGMGLDFQNDFINETRFPVVLDWVVGLGTCKEAKRNLKSYACGDNTDCADSTNGPGYNYYCNPGYEGNPYFLDGCKDTDECSAPKTPCEKTCTNMSGSYDCSCPQGYEYNGLDWEFLVSCGYVTGFPAGFFGLHRRYVAGLGFLGLRFIPVGYGYDAGWNFLVSYGYDAMLVGIFLGPPQAIFAGRYSYSL
ncbi:hypothetical protein GIB67_029719 [Kingdonia uniflora]|uniref:EGF-like calcium-binding domain-containing protein n=1 Tax=Kingdonia uniflora TaxID=39325 RepID=A0A7J7LLY1_9MAGN|nr:hypothetical protein GIB67_029719 [Kingdonia uniflora]